MSPNLQELNTRLIKVGLPALRAADAAHLKSIAPRERVLRALTRIETHNDTGAQTFLYKTFREAGLIMDQQSSARQSDPDNLPPAQDMRDAPQTPERLPERRSSPQTDHNLSDAWNAAPAAPKTRRRAQHHVYGGRAALTFELDETPAGAPTVALDAANSIGERQYDWKQKIRVQFTTRELPVVAATLLGILPECQFSNHGPANDKGFQITWQGDRQSFFVRVWQGKGNMRAVPMPREDAFYAVQIVLRAIQQASPARLDTTGVIATLRAFYTRQ